MQEDDLLDCDKFTMSDLFRRKGYWSIRNAVVKQHVGKQGQSNMKADKGKHEAAKQECARVLLTTGKLFSPGMTMPLGLYVGM